MDEIKLSGFCDLRFTKIKDLLEESLASGFDTGVSIRSTGLDAQIETGYDGVNVVKGVAGNPPPPV